MDENEVQEALARQKAEIDQAVAAMGELARALWTFFSDLTEQGFTEAQALRLCAAWLRTMNSSGSED